MNIMPEIALQSLIKAGLKSIRENPDVLDEIFSMYTMDRYKVYDGGQPYIDKIKDWFLTNNIPVVQSWSFNPEQLPSISIHLADEVEDTSKAAMGDYLDSYEDSAGNEYEIGTGVFEVALDIGIHASTEGDYVLWLFYIVQFIIFAFKTEFEAAGLQLHTYRASAFNKDSKYMANNIWSRWLRFTATTWNTWIIDTKTKHNLQLNLEFESTDPNQPDVSILKINIKE